MLRNFQYLGSVRTGRSPARRSVDTCVDLWFIGYEMLKWGFKVKSNMTLRFHYWLRLNVFISVRKWTLFLTFLKISKIFAPDVNDLFLKILTVKQMIQPTLKQAITTHFLSLSPFRNSTWLPCSEIFQLIQKWHKVTYFDTIIYPFHGFITRINFKHSFDSRQKRRNETIS